MYGKRFAVAFRTERDIAAGEEIFIDYGVDYFNENVPCLCNAFAYPHTSETYRRHVHQDGTVSPMGFGTFGRFDGKKGGRKGTKVVPVVPVVPVPAPIKKGKKFPPLPILPAPGKKGGKEGGKVGKAAAPRPRRRESRDLDAIASPPKQRRRRRSWGSRSWRP